ncbi:thioesterase family protein [Actinomadura formosensis]|uniref:thioesterase family protein n=1 Tax=Actinomadura formosensis TaxID=60706 RepID=UPI003D911A5B
MELKAGLRAETSLVVGEEDTAVHAGSGDVPVLGTPRLVALAEAATVEAVAGRLAGGRTSVGTRVEMRHLAASPVGARVTVEAVLEEVDGKRLVFGVRAVDERGAVGDGRIERVVVDRERFLARLQ